MVFLKRILLSSLCAFGMSAYSTPQTGKYFDRVITVVFENTNYADALREPFFHQLATEGANFTNFLALTHPSQGNYIALTSGDLNGVRDDGRFDLDVMNVVDLLEAKNLKWKVYAENYPGGCYLGLSKDGYERKHNPFISYVNIQTNPIRCANIVNADQFDKDVASGTLPEYVFYIPNLDNDGHDTGVTYAGKWYASKFGPYVADAKFMNNTVLISTFDESGLSAKNQIYTTIVGPMVKAGDYPARVTHPSLLRLVEENWNLGDLGKRDRTANPISGIWK